MQEDTALERVISNPKWSYLEPLRQLRSLYWEVRKPQYRLRKHGEVRKDGQLFAKQNRLGPLHIEARQWMLQQVLAIESQVNQLVEQQGKPKISLINQTELGRIYELMVANTFPDRWDGMEHRGDTMLPEILPDGSIQLLLFDEF